MKNRVCQECNGPMPEKRDPRKLYCTDKCRRRYKARKRALQPATCHPNLPLKARGLCQTCYLKDRNYTSTPQQRWEWHLKAQYGLDIETYNRLLESQNHKCAICEIELVEGGGNANPASPVVDHDHITHKVRGILCRLCNTGIGALRDNPAALVKAANYVMGFDLAIFAHYPQ